MIQDDAPLLFFGGPYSNLNATEALFSEATRLGIPSQNIICTGDVVAYAAEPQATVDLIRKRGIQVVAGNCEEQLANGAADCGCGFEEGSECDRLSQGWYPYALANTDTDGRRWMANLPSRLDFSFQGFRIAVLHGGATENNKFLFASATDALEAEFQAVCKYGDCDLVLVGHSGIPFVRQLARGLWVNAGVIGMPANDGTADGWYALVDGSKSVDLRIDLRRLSYDHLAAADAMFEAGHANAYAQTLLSGIWPSHDVLPPAEKVASGLPLAEIAHVFAPETA